MYRLDQLCFLRCKLWDFLKTSAFLFILHLQFIHSPTLASTSSLLRYPVQKYTFKNNDSSRAETPICNLTFISTTLALTSAECVYPYSLKNSPLLLGENPSKEITDFKTFVHPLYIPQDQWSGNFEFYLQFNIALIEFAQTPLNALEIQQTLELSHSQLEFEDPNFHPKLFFLGYDIKNSEYKSSLTTYTPESDSKNEILEASNALMLKSGRIFKTFSSQPMNGSLLYNNELIGIVTHTLWLKGPQSFIHYSTYLRSQLSQKFLVQALNAGFSSPIKKVCQCKEELIDKYSFLGKDYLSLDQTILTRPRLELIYNNEKSNTNCERFENESIPVHAFGQDADFDTNGTRVLRISACTDVTHKRKTLDLNYKTNLKEEVISDKKMQDTALAFMQNIAEYHFLKTEKKNSFTQERSRAAFSQWLKILDPKESILTASDRDEFKKAYSDNIFQYITNRDLSFISTIENRLFQRSLEQSKSGNIHLAVLHKSQSQKLEDFLTSIGLTFDPHTTYFGPKAARIFKSKTPEISVFIKKNKKSTLAVFKIPEVTLGLAERIKELFLSLKEKPTALVLDLSSNPGGPIPEIEKVVGLFIPQGPVLQIKHSNGQVTIYQDNDPYVLTDIPLFILVNGKTASSAEFIASALKDYQRAIIIGDTTYGKGTIQNSRTLLPKQASKSIFGFLNSNEIVGFSAITDGIAYRVNGESVQKVGVLPHILLPSTSETTLKRESHYTHALDAQPISALQYSLSKELLNKNQLNLEQSDLKNLDLTNSSLNREEIIVNTIFDLLL